MDNEIEIEEVKTPSFRPKYCDKPFKKQLVKAIRTNHGEPNNINKIRGNRVLQEYPEEKIVQFINSIAGDIQKGVENEITDEVASSAFQLANIVNDIGNKQKSQELSMAMKLKAEDPNIPADICTHGVDFRGLTRFLYTSMNGLPDCAKLNEKSLQVLLQTHELLMEQVNKDATPEFLEELKANICAKGSQQSHVGVESLAEAFQDKNLNPLGFPLEFLLKDSRPSHNEPEVNLNPIQIESTMSHKRDLKRKRSAIENSQLDIVTSFEKVPPEK